MKYLHISLIAVLSTIHGCQKPRTQSSTGPAKSPAVNGAQNQNPGANQLPNGVIPQHPSPSMTPSTPSVQPMPSAVVPVRPTPTLQPSPPVPSAFVPQTPVPSAVIPPNPIPSAVIPPSPVPTPNGVIPPSPPIPPGVTTKNLLFPASCLANQLDGHHVTDPGYVVKLKDQAGQTIAAGPMTMDAVTNGSVCPGFYRLGCFRFNIRLNHLASNLTPGSFHGKFSMCRAKDPNSLPVNAECLDLGSPSTNIVEERPRVYQYIDLDVSYVVKDGSVEITKYAGGPDGDHPSALTTQLIVYHPMFAFVNPDICSRDFASPLVLDLDGNGKIDLVDVWESAQPIVFDIMAIGKKLRMGWVAKSDGFLTLGTTIKDGRSLFGEYSVDRNSPTQKGRTFASGVEALKQYDSNGDNMISSQDAVWSELHVWRDDNQNGIAEPTEVKSLFAYNIKEIDLGFHKLPSFQSRINANNKVGLVSTYKTKFGESRTIADVWFSLREAQNLKANMDK